MKKQTEKRMPAAAWILIERRYTRWFLRKLPSGVSLDLPMSAQLESMIQALGSRPTE